MGGFGSSRWGTTVTRPSIQNLLRLDIRTLARDGCLSPGSSAIITWSTGASITAYIANESPDALRLAYMARTLSGFSKQVHDQVLIMRTPCTFGGQRSWFECPGCGCRRAILYAVGARFRCRTCHHLAYPEYLGVTPAGGKIRPYAAHRLEV